ncbi:MAG: multiheme c-type cytochrome [Myxococcota bacterium]
MNEMPSRVRVVAAILLCLTWALAAAQGCDKNGAESKAKSEASEPNSGDESPEKSEDEASGATTLPGEREPGSVQPRSLGPDAPAVFWLAGLKGYLEPCGCSADVLLGGIDRIVGYVQAARELYPATVMVDAGDTFFEFAEIEDHAVPQEKAKTDVIVAALEKLGTTLTVPGERDFALGADFYLKKLKAAGVEPVATNLKIKGEELPAQKVVDLGEQKVMLVGYVDPELYEGIDGVETSALPDKDDGGEAISAPEGVETVVLVMHGDLAATKKVLEAVDGIDFAIVGHAPRETDQIDVVDGGHTLEAYDQGRYLGVLKLYQREGGEGWVNAGAGSESELEKVDKQIAHVKESLERFSPSQRRENPPMLQRLNDRLKSLEQRKDELEAATVEVPESGDAFIYRPVPMEPGLPVNEEMRERRAEYNENLQKLAGEVDREVVPPESGEPEFIGSNNCASCHSEAYEFWEKTQHAHAVETLEERDKLYDDSCIGCHVVGYEQPGGSVIGKLQYEAKVEGIETDKDLREVGCEECHGPGSKHRVQPIGGDGKPQHIIRDPGENECTTCHVPEHSPGFNFESYVKDVTGPGHPMSAGE